MALNRVIFEAFRKEFEARCIQLLSEAYQTSLIKKVVQLDWDENDISAELHEYIKENPRRVKWRVSSNVEQHLSSAVSKVKGFSAKFSRIDFRLTSFISTYEYEYFFEAKNLKETDSALKRRYVKTGIDSFTSGKYKDGSMVGYLLEGNVVKTVDGINALLNKDRRPTETLAIRPNNFHANFYESNHSSTGILKHLIFDFTSI